MAKISNTQDINLIEAEKHNKLGKEQEQQQQQRNKKAATITRKRRRTTTITTSREKPKINF